MKTCLLCLFVLAISSTLACSSASIDTGDQHVQQGPAQNASSCDANKTKSACEKQGCEWFVRAVGNGGDVCVAKDDPSSLTAAALKGDWGHTSMGEDPDGPVSISFLEGGRYKAKMRDGGLDEAREGSFTLFANATDADKTVTFVGDVNRLPSGSYVLLQFDIDGSDLFRISLSADKKKLSFEPAAKQRGQGLHATGTLGVEDTLEKDFNR
jgi:hypothetical protein